VSTCLFPILAGLTYIYTTAMRHSVYKLRQKFAIRPKIRKFLNSYLMMNYAADTELYFRLKSLETTCAYIQAHMLHVPTLTNKFDLMMFALSKAPREGLYCEFGVFKGESLAFMKANIPQDVHGFDSFEGLPEYWRPGFTEGTFKVKKVPRFKKGVHLHIGWFNDTIPKFVAEYGTQKIAFLHVDCDLYSSTKAIFEGLLNQIQDGTIILFDEYFNCPNWEEHEYKAFQEFIQKNNYSYEYLAYNCKGYQVAVRVKKK
jgi:hypothetical protein